MTCPSQVGGGSNDLTPSSPIPPLLPESRADRSSDTVDLDFLSPPDTPGELEDLPYKPCCSSSESLNMAQRRGKEHGHGGHKHKTKKKISRVEGKMRLEAPPQSHQTHEYDVSGFNGLLDCQNSTATTTKPGGYGDQSGSSIGSIGTPQNIAKESGVEDQDCFFLSRPKCTAAAKIKWRSVNIGAKVIPETKLQIITAERIPIDIEHLPHSSRTQGHKESSFNKAVRDRLANRKMLDIHPNPPNSITLSRPNDTNSNDAGELVQPSDMNDVVVPNVGQAHGCNRVMSSSTTVEEIGSVIQSTHFGSQRRTSADGTNIPSDKQSLLQDDSRRPSVLGRGVVPQPSIPATHATMIDIVRQLDSTCQMPFRAMRKPSLDPVLGSKKINKTPSASAYEVIWKTTCYYGGAVIQ